MQKMFLGKRYRNTAPDFSSLEPQPFSLPAPLPNWPPGQGFATGTINLGEIEVVKITHFKSIWRFNPTRNKHKSVAFYQPIEIPEGFHCLGHFCQSNNHPLHGFLLAAREVASANSSECLPALRGPLDYSLIWSSNDGSQETYSEGGCYIWLPHPPDGYMPMGYLVTNRPDKPELDEVRCVRADLTDRCETHSLIVDFKFSNFLLQVHYVRPFHRGMQGKGVSVGVFHCGNYQMTTEKELPIACLKNLNPILPSMPNLDQIHALINHYGPTIFFHPKELYLPSSLPWFFKNGALLYKAGVSSCEEIEINGFNLPNGGTNDGGYWIDLPTDNERRDRIKRGNLESARLYVHVKPALGGTFTDIVMWVFCPFNGPATVKIGIMNIPFTRIGEHVGDWEHFTLRISNFKGELWSVYFSQHSGGVWVNAYDLEYIEGNKAIVYSSKSGHASYPHARVYIQGSSKLGIGIRNDCGKSDYFVDSSKDYEVVSAKYLGDGIVNEPNWLQFMREWGPTIVYCSRKELDRIINHLPVTVRCSVKNVFAKLPVELSREEGPTGPKEKNNWEGDERW